MPFIKLLHAAIFFWFNQFVQPARTVVRRSVVAVSLYCYRMQHPRFVASIDLYCLSLHRGLLILLQLRIRYLLELRRTASSEPLVSRHFQQLWQL